MPKKIKTGDPLVSAGFVGYDTNELTERGDPLHYLKCAASILVVVVSTEFCISVTKTVMISLTC